jgi:CRISPR/Cas system-associated protein endoribonuclease Cas2
MPFLFTFFTLCVFFSLPCEHKKNRKAWETGHGITLATSFILAFFSILSTWISWTQATTISNEEEESTTTKKNESDDNQKQMSIMKLDGDGDRIFQKQQRLDALSTPFPMTTTKHPSGGGGLAASIFSLYTSSSSQSSQQKSGRYSA